MRLIVGGDEEAFYARKNGPWGDKPYAIWSALTGGSRYTDLLHIDGTAAGDGAINDVHYTGGVLLTGSVDGSFGAQLPDGLDVPGVWIDFDGRSSRVFLPARQPDGSLPVSAQGASSAALASEVTARQTADNNVANAAATDATAKANAALSAAATDATTKANAAQATAISTAAADATSKVNAAVAAGVATYGLVRTAVKTGAYTAAPGDLVPVDTTSGSVTVTLPNAPVDGANLVVKHVVLGTGNTVTVACSGADVLNKAGGATSLTLSLVNQAARLVYNAAAHVWTVVGDDLPLGQLDARFVAKADLAISQGAIVSSTVSDSTGLTITVSSVWGIAGTSSPTGFPSGTPYYEPTGAYAGETAALSFDPVDGQPVLTKVG